MISKYSLMPRERWSNLLESVRAKEHNDFGFGWWPMIAFNSSNDGDYEWKRCPRNYMVHRQRHYIVLHVSIDQFSMMTNLSGTWGAISTPSLLYEPIFDAANHAKSNSFHQIVGNCDLLMMKLMIVIISDEAKRRRRLILQLRDFVS